MEGYEGPKVEGDPSHFDKHVLFIQAYHNVSSLSWIEKLKIELSTKAWFCIPLCIMVPMPIVRLLCWWTFKRWKLTSSRAIVKLIEFSTHPKK